MPLVPHPHVLFVGVPQPCNPGTLPSLAPAARRDLRRAACLPTAPWGHSTGPGQDSNTTPFCQGPRASWPGWEGEPGGRETRAWSLCLAGYWHGRDWDMAGGHPVVCGWPPSCNRSWEQLYKPCPASGHQLSLSGGQRWVRGAPGLRPYTLPRQSTGAGWCLGETVPWAMLVPAWGAQRPAALWVVG